MAKEATAENQQLKADVCRMFFFINVDANFFWGGETVKLKRPMIKGQLGVPLTVYIGISHRGTLVGVHPTIP